MTKLEININQPKEDKPVRNGDVRSDGEGTLVLISHMTDDDFIAIQLRARERIKVFESTSSVPITAEIIAESYPYLLDDVLITVELMNYVEDCY